MSVSENFERLKSILSELEVVNEELRKVWNTPSATLYTSSFEDMQSYISKILAKYEQKYCSDSEQKSEKLSDFSF